MKKKNSAKKQDLSLEKQYREFSPEFVMDNKGHMTKVLLKFEVFENMVEDLHDLAIIAERRDEPTIDYEEFRKELKRKGKI